MKKAETKVTVSPSSASASESIHVRSPDLEKVDNGDGNLPTAASDRGLYALGESAGLKKDIAGHVLIPQPSDDPDDPLNWSNWKKGAIFLVIALGSCTADYAAATGASALIPQAREWGLQPEHVNHATAGNTFMLGVGGLLTVWLSTHFGRLPVLFWFQTLGAATGAWLASAQSFKSWMAARILNGMFCVAAAGGGLMWIEDMFFFHQRPRMVNIWSTALILSPFLGPQIMAAILEHHTWRVGMWLSFGFTTAVLLLLVTFGDESFYPRHLPRNLVPPRKSRAMRMIGIEQFRSRYTGRSFWSSGRCLLRTIAKPPVFLTCFFYFLDFPWTIANNTTISALIIPNYHFKFKNLAAVYTAPVVGAILSWAVGHFLFDRIGNMWAKRHQGRIDPEARLVPIWIVFPLKIVGYNLIGTSLEQRWNYWIIVAGWGMHNFGTIMTTAAVAAYLIDAYPEASGECAAWLNAARLLSGFICGYFHLRWARAQGTQLEFGIESTIMAAAFFVVVYLQFFGVRLRRKYGPVVFDTVSSGSV